MQDTCLDHCKIAGDALRHEKWLNSHSEELVDVGKCLERLTAIQEESQRREQEARKRDEEFRAEMAKRNEIYDQQISELQQKPGKRWDLVATTIIASLSGGLATTFLGRMY